MEWIAGIAAFLVLSWLFEKLKSPAYKQADQDRYDAMFGYEKKGRRK